MRRHLLVWAVLFASMLLTVAGVKAQPFMFGGGGLSGVTSTGTVVDITSTSGAFCIGSDACRRRAGAGLSYLGDASTNAVLLGGTAAGTGRLQVGNAGGYEFASGASVGGATDTRLCRTGPAGVGVNDGNATCTTNMGTFTAANITATASIRSSGTAFASLGTPSNGVMIYCTNCDAPAAGASTTCTSAGGQTGALAVRLNGAWICVGA